MESVSPATQAPFRGKYFCVCSETLLPSGTSIYYSFTYANGFVTCVAKNLQNNQHKLNRPTLYLSVYEFSANAEMPAEWCTETINTRRVLRSSTDLSLRTIFKHTQPVLNGATVSGLWYIGRFCSVVRRLYRIRMDRKSLTVQ